MHTIEELRSLLGECDAKLASLRAKAADTNIKTEELAGINKEIDTVLEERGKYNGMIEAMTEQAKERAKTPMIKFDKDSEVSLRASKEYKNAFTEYLRSNGKKTDELLMREAGEGVSEDLGILVPKELRDDIITSLGDVYGSLYNEVQHTNFRGGIEIPVGDFDAEVKWSGDEGTDTEHGVTKEQKPAKLGSVSFKYYIAEARIAQSLLQGVLMTPAYEEKISESLAKAIAKDWDNQIVNGTGSNSPLGLAVDTRVTNKIGLTATDMANWDNIRKKVFAATPSEFDAENPRFAMNKATYEANILCLKDKNNRPLALQTPLTNGTTSNSFFGRAVTTSPVFKSFDTAANGDVIGLYWIPQMAYAINGVADFGMRRWFDEQTNKYYWKVLYIADGKPLNTSAVYLLTKSAAA